MQAIDTIMLFLAAAVDIALIFQIYMEQRLYSWKGGSPGRATVIVPLRGEEPALEDNVRSILNQDHGDFRAIYVVDSDEMEMQAARLKPFGVQVIETEEMCERCGGKVKAILTGLKHSDGSVVIADSDTVYPRHWLSTITSMLSSYNVVTVFSWPRPLRISASNLMRSGIWTLGFESQAIGGRFLWGGSMAFREGEIDEEVIKELSGEWCDDCALTRISKERGWSMGYAAGATPLNEFDEKNLMGWTIRELRVILTHSGKAARAFLVVAAILLALLVMFAITANWIYLTPFALWLIKNLLRGRKYGRLAVLPSIMSLPAIFYACFMFAVAARAKSVRWRGREYRVSE